MKRTISAILIICMMLVLISCGSGEELQENLAQEIPTMQPTPDEPQPIPLPPRESKSEQAEAQEREDVFPGKISSEPQNWRIAIVTHDSHHNEGEFRAVADIKDRVGEDRIVHRTWPVYFATEPETMVTILEEIAADSNILALVVSQAALNTNATIERFREMRDDVFIIYASEFENPQESSDLADFILGFDPLGFASVAVGTAHEMGASTFVHYSFQRYMLRHEIIAQRDAMRAEAEKLGIKFVELIAYDPMEVGSSVAQQFIFDDMVNVVSHYGIDTAFFGVACFFTAFIDKRCT